jgi:peptide/nickel transport system substrate-binding protein
LKIRVKENNMFTKIIVYFFRVGRICLISGLILAVFSAACVPAQTSIPEAMETTAPTATPSKRGIGDTLSILSPEAPALLNPHLSSAGKDQEASRITYEPLASFDKDGNLVPILAAEIPSLENGSVAKDGKSVTWKLRPGIHWSDGEAFTAEDVLFTFEFITNPDVNAVTTAAYRGVENVAVIDDTTVKINFTDATPAWYLPFVGFQGVILPKHIFEAYNGPNAQDAPANKLPVGTGPYRVLPPGIKPQEVLFLGTQLIETNKIVFEPNPYFRDEDKPYFSRVELRGGGTPSEAARLVLDDGSVDFSFVRGQLPPDALERLNTSDQGRLVTAFGTVLERIMLNRTDPNKETVDGERSSLKYPHPFFSDKKVRQAFAYATNREAIAALYGPSGLLATNNLVAPPQYNSPNTFYSYDLEKAKELLDEAGWVDTNGDGYRDKDGVKMKVVFQAKVGKSAQEIQQVVKATLESIGIEVALKIIDPSIMFGPVENPDADVRFNADLIVEAIGSPSPDPASYMLIWTCGQIPQKENGWYAGLNMERWCNPEYDDLYQRALTELDPEKRAQLFIQMNDMLIEDVVMIPLVIVSWAQAITKQNIEGIDLTSWDTTTWNIQDWRRVSP